MPGTAIARTDTSHPRDRIIPAAKARSQFFHLVLSGPQALDASATGTGAENLNQLLADTITLRDLYRKHHWQASGPTLYTLHLLFDKHFGEQAKLVDLLAARVQTIGGDAVTMSHDVAEATLIPRAPKGREDTTAQFARLLRAHEIILLEARAMARDAAAVGDLGTCDVIVSSVIRTGEAQARFLAEHGL